MLWANVWVIEANVEYVDSNYYAYVLCYHLFHVLVCLLYRIY